MQKAIKTKAKATFLLLSIFEEINQQVICNKQSAKNIKSCS